MFLFVRKFWSVNICAILANFIFVSIEYTLFKHTPKLYCCKHNANQIGKKRINIIDVWDTQVVCFIKIKQNEKKQKKQKRKESFSMTPYTQNH